MIRSLANRISQPEVLLRLSRRAAPAAAAAAGRDERSARRAPRARARRHSRCSSSIAETLQHAVGHDTSLFSKPVLGYIETKFCNQIRILQQFAKSTKLSCRFLKIFAKLKICKNSQNSNFGKICKNSGFCKTKILIFCENR